jgi:tetratricopeptide (TPR) repeat protein
MEVAAHLWRATSLLPPFLLSAFGMARKNPRKSKPNKVDHSQRMNRLKAKALAQVAGKAWAGHQRYKSITLLAEAVRRDPKNPDLLLSLAVANGQQRSYDKAEQLLTRVLELAPNKASIHRRVGETYAQIDRPQRAIECYRRSLELNQDSAATVQTLVELAGMYERIHQLADAQAAIEEAISRDPDNGNIRLQQATLHARCGETAKAETALHDLAGDTNRHPQIQSNAWYELGQLLDDSGRYDDAFAAFVAAKQLLRPHAAGFVGMIQGTLLKNQEVLDSIDKTAYENWRKQLEHDSTYRFAALTGHPRSGTTLIEQVLDSHDELKSADEFDVFSEWIHQPIVRRFRPDTPLLTLLDYVPLAVWKEARATYWKQTEAIFDEPIGERMLIDKNPGMTIMLPFVNWAFPEMKMLIALRDPRDVILSCFMQKVSLTPISVNWLSLSAAADYYARVMKTWLVIRPLTAGSWTEFRYEDLVGDLEREARRILKFLGLPWDDKVLKFYEHARDKMVRSPTYRDVTKPVYHKSIGRWKNYERHFEPILEKLEPFAKEFGYQ